MSRRIVTTQLQAEGSGPADGYFDKVVKYIPADIVAAWISADQLIKAARDDPGAGLLWMVFVVGFILTPLWMLKQTKAPNKPPAYRQAVVATAAFTVWVFALGGPFAEYDWYDTLYGGLLLIGFTLAAGLISPGDA